MAPRYIDKSEKTKHIARAALQVFSQKGYNATSVGKIAKTAGIGKGTIYTYYDSKADLFMAAAMEWMRQLEEAMSAQLKDIEDPLARLRRFIEMNLEVVESIEPATVRLTIDVLEQTLLETGALHHRRYLIKELHTGMRQMLINVLLDGISKGIFLPELAREAEKIAVNLLGYLDGISLHYILSENYFDIREQVEFALQNIIRLLTVPGVHPSDQAGMPTDDRPESRQNKGFHSLPTFKRQDHP